MVRKSLKSFPNIRRLSHILGVIFVAGGEIFVRRIKLNYLVPISFRIRSLFHPSEKRERLIRIRESKYLIDPVVLRTVLEQLGPTFIKLGQVLSLRADLVGERISSELSNLQSNAPPFAYERARSIVREELGDLPEKVFEKFDEKPIAAASLSQVHRALLNHGTEVAVKIQRPEIRRIIEQDIHILFYIALKLEKHFPEMQSYQPVRVVREFADWTMRELDFAAEGHNADRFHAMFSNDPHINIPGIYWKYSSKKVLTMDFVHGVKADDLEGMKNLGVDARELARCGVNALFHQFFVEGFFHADPHPGNFFALKTNVLCLHDFGMVGHLTQTERQELLSCLAAFVNRDIESFIRHFFHLAMTDTHSDLEGYRKDLITLLNEFFYSPGRPSVAWLFFRAMNKGALRGVRFPADLALFGKAIVTTEAMGLKLYPEFDFDEEMKPFVNEALKEYLSPAKTLKTLESNMFDYLEFIKNIPDHIQGVIEKLKKGEMSVKLNAADFRDIMLEFNRQNSVGILGMILVGVFLGLMIFLHLEGRQEIMGFSIISLSVGLLIVIFSLLLFRLRKGLQ